MKIRDLQAANAYQLHVIRLLQVELTAKRAENAAYLRQIKTFVERSSSPQEPADPTAAAVRASEARSTCPPLGSLLNASLGGSLVDLGERNPDLKGVASLKQDAAKFSTDRPDGFQDLIAGYSRAFQAQGYILGLYAAELRRLGLAPTGVAVDFHPSLNNTVAPLLSSYSDLSVVAVGAAPFELAALRRSATEHGVADRCAVIAANPEQELFKPEVANFVFGGTILHKLVHPKLLLKRTIEALKPGGYAIFFAPFEDGHAILRLAYEEIIREAKVRKLSGRGFDYLQSLSDDITARSLRQRHPGVSTRWFDLEDKWLFSKSDLEQYCSECGAAAVHIRALNDRARPFVTQTRSSLQNYAGLAVPDALPDWAWNTLRRYDDDAFSEELLHDLVLEGTIVAVK